MFRLKVETDNAAFGDTPTDRAREVARILRDLAGRLDRSTTDGAPGAVGRVRDLNGNTCGEYAFRD